MVGHSRLSGKKEVFCEAVVWNPGRGHCFCVSCHSSHPPVFLPSCWNAIMATIVPFLWTSCVQLCILGQSPETWVRHMRLKQQSCSVPYRHTHWIQFLFKSWFLWTHRIRTWRHAMRPQSEVQVQVGPALFQHAKFETEVNLNCSQNHTHISRLHAKPNLLKSKDTWYFLKQAGGTCTLVVQCLTETHWHQTVSAFKQRSGLTCCIIIITIWNLRELK